MNHKPHLAFMTNANSRMASFTIGGNDLAKNFRVFIREGDPVVYGLTTTVFDNAASTKAQRNLAPVFECVDSDIVVDCIHLEYISSSGLRILLSIFKHAHGNGHAAILKGMTDSLI